MMRVLGYSWSTLLWHRCYYPHRSRDALSPVYGIFTIHYSVTYSTAWSCRNAHCCNVIQKSVLHITVMYCIAQHCTTQYCIVMHCTERCYKKNCTVQNSPVHYSVNFKQYSGQYLQSSPAILVCCFRASATLYKSTALCYNLLDTVLKNVYVAAPGVFQTKVLWVRSLSLSLCQVPVLVPLSGPCPCPFVRSLSLSLCQVPVLVPLSGPSS